MILQKTTNGSFVALNLAKRPSGFGRLLPDWVLTPMLPPPCI
jgi:hypothetical protein